MISFTLSEIVAAVEAGDPIAPEARAMANRLVRAIDMAKDPAADRAARRERDRLICAYAYSYWPNIRSLRGLAERIAMDEQIYAAGEWRFHVHSVQCPESIKGTKQGAMWAIKIAYRDFPTVERLRKILGHHLST